MKTIGIFLAVSFHLAVILFGGMFLLTDKEKAARAEENLEMEIEEEKPEQKEEEKPDEKHDEDVEKEEKEEAPQGPALAPSLADLDVALGGLSGEGGFGVGNALSGGGGIGGGDGGSGGSGADVLSASQLDQKPRLIKKVDPKPPAALAKKLPQLTVTVFIDAGGNVMRADLAPAVDPSAMKPIMDAVLRWKYEPGQRNGQKVGCKVSHKINFQG
jgi:outer membrane biosynthesis protein TonB